MAQIIDAAANAKAQLSADPTVRNLTPERVCFGGDTDRIEGYIDLKEVPLRADGYHVAFMTLTEASDGFVVLRTHCCPICGSSRQFGGLAFPLPEPCAGFRGENAWGECWTCGETLEGHAS